MTACKRELRVRGVIENSSRPCCRCVTDRAILRKSCGYVVRILRAVVITEMAGNAFLGFALIHSILMTIDAGKRCMPTRQRELCCRRVVERSSRPACRVVAVRTRLRELGRFVVRIRCRGVIGQVARYAVLVKTIVYPALMATGAG